MKRVTLLYIIMEEIIDLCDDSFDKDDDYVSVVVDNGNDNDNDYSNQFYSDRNTTLEGDYINTEVSSTTGPVDLPVRVSIPERKAETNVKSKPKPTLKAQLSTISSKAATSSSSSSSLIAATSSSCQYKSYYPKNANAFRRKGGTNAAVTAVTSIAAVKVPQTNNAYREVGLVVEDSVINRQHIKKLLECFTVQASNMSLLLLTPDGIGTNKNKKERIQNELILRELEQNQLRAHTDHSLFRLYADKRLTIPGLCLWTHRRIELGGNCGLGGTNSTVYPFSVILYSSERFANLVFSSLLDRYTVTSGISCSSSSIGTGSRIASIFSEEFSLLHDEVVCLRKRLQDILGEQSGRCRLTLVLTALDIHLVAKVKEVVRIVLVLHLFISIYLIACTTISTPLY